MIFCFIISVSNNIFAALVGSDTVVERFNSQQLLNTGDRIAGFAALAGGFGLVSVNTTATFDSFFGVSGPIALNGGKLLLNRDLIMQQVSSFFSMGSIVGYGHNWRLSSLIGSFPLSSPMDCTVSFITALSGLLVDITSVDWSYDGRFLAIGLSFVLLGTELWVYEFNGSSLTLASQASIGILGVGVESVRWHPSRYSLAISTLSNLLGAELRLYNYDSVTKMLSLSDSAEYGANLNAVAWHPSGNFLAFGGSSNTQEIVVRAVNSNNTLGTSSVTINLASNQDVNRNALDWDVTGSFLAVGLTDLLVYRFSPLPSLSLTLNASISSISALAVDWNPTYSNILAVGLLSLSPELRMYSFNSGMSSLTLMSSQVIGDPVYSVDWHTNGECLAIGTDNGLLSGLSISNITSLLGLGILLGTRVGTVRWSPNSNYLAVGTDASQVLIYRSNMLDLNSCFTWTDLNIQLTNDVIIKNTCIVFDGRGSINGNGNSFTIDSSCLASIGRKASMAFSNMTLYGLQYAQLACLDNAVTVTFQNMTIVLDHDYTFSIGRFDIIGEVHIVGSDHSFIYTSTQQSIIHQNSSLVLDDGVTFSYAPVSQVNNAFTFVDSTSVLKLNNAIFFSSSMGVNLKKGSLHIDGASVLFSQGENVSQAISFGDGISSSNNVAVKIFPAGVLSCKGFIVDQNV
jgi:hypothetical protein